MIESKAPHGFPVVGIGASAGGLTALKAFFERVPQDSGLAFVVIVHLSKDHESLLDRILQSSCAIPVRQVTEKITVEPNHVYVIPPTKNLTMIDGSIALVDRAQPGEARMPVDLFFRTLGEAYGRDSYAVVLSGSGNDGTLGIERIKEVGGVTLAQDPGEAEFASMPASAIATQMIDVVLPSSELCDKILSIHHRAAQTAPAPDRDDSGGGTDNEIAALRDILSLVRIRTGHDFSSYKRPTLLRRVARRIQVHDRPDMASYLKFLREHPEEIQKLLRDLLITVTNFFRDKEAFLGLEDEVIPKLFDGKTAKDTVRVWSCGTGTGEEAYALAILLHEYRSSLLDPPKIQVFASDINEDAIRFARNGVYRSAIAGDVSSARLARFFFKKGETYAVTKELRDSVLFAPHNVLRDPPFSQLDLIACRNLLIYFNRDTQTKVMELFSFALSPGGHLFLGSSEGAEGHERLFAVVEKKFRIFRNVQTIKRPLSTPASLGIAWAAKPAETGTPTAQQELPLEGLHQELASRLAPPSVLINESLEILHMSEGMSRYLQFSSGAPTLDLLRSLHPSLQLDMRAALMAAKQEQHETEVRNVRFQLVQGEDLLVNLMVRPVTIAQRSGGHYLAIFDERSGEQDPSGAHVFEALSGDSAMEAVVRRLEEELQQSRERLRLTTEHAEVATEELKASNEELQAINEELRSATEELETSKEELQSVNEEMVTVNLELNDKVEEISRSHSDLQNLMHSTDIGTIFLARDLTIKRYTRRVELLFNIIESDVGRPLEHLTHKFDYMGLVEDARTVLLTLAVVEREVHMRATGNYYLARISPYRTLDDRIEGVVISFVEITQLKLVTETLRRQEAQLAMAQEVARAGAWTLDLVRRQAWCSGEYLKLHYLETGSMEMSKDEWIRRIHPHEGDKVRSLIWEAVQGHSQYMHEFRVESGREERWIMEIGRATYDESGEGVTLSGISVDITEKIKLRDESLRKKKREEEQLAEASRRKDEFLALLAHELRTPLSPMRTGIALLKGHRLSLEDHDRILNTVEKQTSHMVHLIDDLLDISRVTQGKLNLQMQPIDLRPVLEDAIEATQPLIAENGQALIFSAIPEPLLISGDKERLLQVFSNLINNAAKYTPRGGRILVSAAAESDSGRISIVVEDNGEGIEPEMQQSIFELFSQVSHPDRVSNGLGLGLSLVRTLVERHQGSVEIYSAGRGCGSRFTVRLPALAAGAALPAEEASVIPGAPVVGDPTPVEPRPYRRVMVVDDSRTAADIMLMFFEMEGYDARVAYSGAEAVQAVTDFQPDLVFMDIGMPGMSGNEAAREIRKLPGGRDVTLVALTGWGQESDRRQAMDAGFDHHLVKPASPEAIRALLEGRAQGGV